LLQARTIVRPTAARRRLGDISGRPLRAPVRVFRDIGEAKEARLGEVMARISNTCDKRGILLKPFFDDAAAVRVQDAAQGPARVCARTLCCTARGGAAEGKVSCRRSLGAKRPPAAEGPSACDAAPAARKPIPWPLALLAAASTERRLARVSACAQDDHSAKLYGHVTAPQFKQVLNVKVGPDQNTHAIRLFKDSRHHGVRTGVGAERALWPKERPGRLGLWHALREVCVLNEVGAGQTAPATPSG
jgi:hypothetical protein